jgi:hypothetical protein
MNHCRRALGPFVVAMLLAVGVVAGAGAATAAPTREKACPPSSTSSCPTTGPGGQTHLPGTHNPPKYCVSGYKPGTVVTITNPATGVSQTVTVGSNGKACTPVTLANKCQTITATGTASNGQRTSSSSRVCKTPTTKAAASSLPFTGSNAIVPGTAIGVILLVVGGLLVAVTRRRRSSVGRHAVPTA